MGYLIPFLKRKIHASFVKETKIPIVKQEKTEYIMWSQ